MKLSKYKEKINSICKKGDIEKLKLLLSNTAMDTFTYQYLSSGLVSAQEREKSDLVSFILSLERFSIKSDDLSPFIKSCIYSQDFASLSALLAGKEKEFLPQILNCVCSYSRDEYRGNSEGDKKAYNFFKYLHVNFSIEEGLILPLLERAGWCRNFEIGRYILSDLNAYKSPEIKRKLVANSGVGGNSAFKELLNILTSLEEKEKLDLTLPHSSASTLHSIKSKSKI